MVILLKIKGRDFFQRDSISAFLSSNCCNFQMKHVTGMETCTQIYFLFKFNLVQIKVRTTSLFWLYNLMTSLWKPSIEVDGAFMIMRYINMSYFLIHSAWIDLILPVKTKWKVTLHIDHVCSNEVDIEPLKVICISRYRNCCRCQVWLHW